MNDKKNSVETVLETSSDAAETVSRVLDSAVQARPRGSSRRAFLGKAGSLAAMAAAAAAVPLEPLIGGKSATAAAAAAAVNPATPTGTFPIGGAARRAFVFA